MTTTTTELVSARLERLAWFLVESDRVEDAIFVQMHVLSDRKALKCFNVVVVR